MKTRHKNIGIYLQQNTCLENTYICPSLRCTIISCFHNIPHKYEIDYCEEYNITPDDNCPVCVPIQFKTNIRKIYF